MTTAYPGSLDNFTNPTPTETTQAGGHEALHSGNNDAIEAIEAKVGTGASTPDTGLILGGTGPGASGWIDPTTLVALAGVAIWSPAATIIAPNTTAVDTGFQIDYLAAGEKWAFDMFISHNRQAATGGLRLRWHPTDGTFTGGLVRASLELGMASGKLRDGFGDETPLLDIWYGGIVPDANNSPRMGLWKGTLVMPATPTAGTVKLQISSVAAAEAQLSPRSWIQFSKIG